MIGVVGRLVASAVAMGTGATLTFIAPPAKSYPNCAAMQRAYPHGVGKTGAKDKVGKTAKPVTTFYRSNKVYAMNNGPRRGKEYDLDRDNDGVACEKK